MADVRLTAAITGSLTKILDEEFAAAASHCRSAVETAGLRLRDKLRAQVRTAGLGAGLEKAWQMKVFPRGNAPTLRPAALVYSKAQKLHWAYSQGGIIRAKNGAKYLAVPTEYVPYKFSPRRKMTPIEVEASFNQELVFIPHGNGRPGGVLVLKRVVIGKNTSKRRYKEATKRRLKQGRAVETVVMFVLIPSARLKKVLDIDGPAQAAQAEMYQLLLEGGDG